MPCVKEGGVCSLRLYNREPDGSASRNEGEDGDLRVTCPHRFKQDGTIYTEVAKEMLEMEDTTVVKEVRFLKRASPESSSEGTEEPKPSKRPKRDDTEDVGNIDNVLVGEDRGRLEWCALEIQAVYFSGEAMNSTFEQIEKYDGEGVPFPDKNRRPDYRSSGPKRLMPQLQIKVPTLRRWGKKMAVVIDDAWFRKNVIGVPTVSDVSNCDIVWYVVGFDESTDPAALRILKRERHTLEDAVKGLTGGYPVTRSEFEAKIREKMAAEVASKSIAVAAAKSEIVADATIPEPNPDSDR